MPTTTAPQSATFSEIAVSIVSRLVEVTDLSTSYVKVVATDDYKLQLIDDHFICVRYYGLEPWTDYGAGRRVRRCKRLIRVYLYSRDALDSVGEDPIALLADGGHSDLEESVMNALDEFVPVNSDNEPLVVEPLHPLDDSSGPPLRQSEDDIGVIRSSMLFEIQYILVNTTTL